jgi:uncharacterized protein YecE (DUF72 family)
MRNSLKPLPNVRIGCSGWHYRHWRGEFYPPDLPSARWFEFYCGHFDTVELNNTFYRLPEEHTFRTWSTHAPKGFEFALKASKYLTHSKKLVDPEEPLSRFYSRARQLGEALGPVVFQLPPRWRLNLPRLTGFLAALPNSGRHVVEFRDPSWYVDEVFDALERHGVALCLHDMEGSSTGRRRVGPFVYIRFHGPLKYSGSYSDEELENWVHWCCRNIRDDVPVYAYFNNDASGDAPRDAIRLKRKISRRLASSRCRTRVPQAR